MDGWTETIITLLHRKYKSETVNLTGNLSVDQLPDHTVDLLGRDRMLLRVGQTQEYDQIRSFARLPCKLRVLIRWSGQLPFVPRPIGSSS